MNISLKINQMPTIFPSCPSATVNMNILNGECNEILLSHKKEENFPIYNNMDGLGGYYAK